jgi:hypothetical protein
MQILKKITANKNMEVFVNLKDIIGIITIIVIGIVIGIFSLIDKFKNK